MPHHKSAIKSLRSEEVRRERNHHVKSSVRSAVKKVKTASSPEEAAEAYRVFTSTIDKAVKKGVYRDQTASRMKSKMSQFTKPSE